MPAKLYTRIGQTETGTLLALLSFFDHPDLRRYYTGLIDDVLQELATRGIEAPARAQHDDDSTK